MTDNAHFISGLPRSGSTLLCNILNQNPKFWATPTDGVIEILLSIRNQFENVTAFRAAPNAKGKDAIMKAIIPAYTSVFGRETVFLKNRAFPSYVEMLEFVLERKVKIICTVRTVVDVIASFEKLYRKNAHNWQVPQEKTDPNAWKTVEGRAELLMKDNQPIGSSYNTIKDILDRGYKDRVLFVDFDDLTINPTKELKRVYKFISEEYFEHNFKNIKQTTRENDLIHGFPGLHNIREEVKPFKTNAHQILGERLYKKYLNAQFWR